MDGIRNTQRFSVAHITEVNSGGVFSVIEELLKHQIDHDDIERLFILSPPSVHLNSVSAERAKVETFDFGHRGRTLRGMWDLSVAAVHLLQSKKIDIIHVHSTIAGLIIRPLAWVIGSKRVVIYCPHAWAFLREGSWIKTRLIIAIERVLAELCDAIICVSHSERHHANQVGVPMGKCVMIPNGVVDLTPQLAQRPKDGPLRIGFIGRFDRQKRFELFLEILSQLRSDAKGYALGDFVVNSDRALVIPSNVELLGWGSRDDANKLLQSIDLLLVPSLWEGMPMVVIEAMRAGTAIFCSDAGGLKELVRDGVNGKIFSIHATAESIADLIRSYRRDDFHRFGRQGRRLYLDHYTSQKMSQDVMQLYRTLRATSS